MQVASTEKMPSGWYPAQQAEQQKITAVKNKSPGSAVRGSAAEDRDKKDAPGEAVLLRGMVLDYLPLASTRAGLESAGPSLRPALWPRAAARPVPAARPDRAPLAIGPGPCLGPPLYPPPPRGSAPFPMAIGPPGR